MTSSGSKRGIFCVIGATSMDLALLQFGTQCVTLALGLNDTQGQSVQYHY